MAEPNPAPKLPFPSGVAAIDRQHVELLTTIQELRQAMREQQGEVAVSRALGFLITYTDDHFRFEEAYMRQLGFPAVDAHLREHAFFRAQIHQLRERLGAGDGSVALELASLLFTWFQEHLLNEDRAYAEFARGCARGAKP
jgi:hemerythrin-like metal-binding protein